MEKTKIAALLLRYKEIFEEVRRNDKLKSILQFSDGNSDPVWLNFASPLSLTRNDADYQRDVLVLGINPSYRKDAKGKTEFNARSIQAGTIDYLSFAFGLEDKAFEEDSYFGKIIKLVDDARIERNQCGYLDLFVHRKTEQDTTVKLADDQSGREFLVKQLEVFHEIVFELVKPKLIIILNSGVQNYLGLNATKNKNGERDNVWLGYETGQGDLIGTQKVLGIAPKLSAAFVNRSHNFKPCRETHFLPSSILTYMSNEKKSRLVWTIHHFAYLNGIKMQEKVATQNIENHRQYIEGIMESVSDLKLQFENFESGSDVLVKSQKVHKAMNELLAKYWKFPL